MSITGAIFFGMIIGLLLGACLADAVMAVLVRIAEVFLTVVLIVPFFFYYPLRFVFRPVDADRWEKNKHFFKYKRLFKNFYICCDAGASRPWKMIFFMRIKK